MAVFSGREAQPCVSTYRTQRSGSLGVAGGGWGICANSSRQSFAASDLQCKARFTLSHRPLMVHRKERLESEGEEFEQRFRRRDLPVVGNVDPLAILRKGPNASPDKIPFRQQRKPV